MFIRLAILCCVSSALMVHADINVVATTPNLAMLARTIGGDSIQVRSLTTGQRDLQFIEFRAGMMTAMRPAMMLVSLGVREEQQFLPVAIRASNNTRVEPGQPGHFVAAEHLTLIPYPASQTAGGESLLNAHFTLDPERMAELGRALAEQMAVIRPGRANEFRANAESFARAVSSRMETWRREARGAPGVLPYHIDTDYLLLALNVPMLGYIQSRADEVPSAEQLADLMMSLRGTEGVIWFTYSQPRRAGEIIAKQMNWPLHHLPISVDVNGAQSDYFDLIDAWVKALR